MGPLGTLKSRLTPFAPAILQFFFWASLWFGLQSGNIEKIGSTRDLWSEFQNFRALVPLLAGTVGFIVIAYGLIGRWSLRRIFFGPMGLMVVYGFVGIVSALLSPDFTVAIYWVGIYLAVPFVAWAVASREDSLAQVSHLLKFNWFVVISAVVILIVVAFLFLNLHKIILEPSNLLECRLRASFHGESWLEITSGKLRSTGVGRYAAIAAIVALGGLWQGRGRYIWGLILVGAMLLLVTSGARASFVGFGFAAALVIFLQGGWKAALAVFGGMVVVGAIFWSVGLDRTILERCFLSGYQAGTSLLRVSSPTSVALAGPTKAPDNPDSNEITAQIKSSQDPGLGENEGANNQFGGILVPSGLFTFSGRTVVWKAGWELLKSSPLLGYGFQGDRLVLGTHMHNAVLQALFQTGWFGFIPFAGALIWGWFSLIRALTALSRLPVAHKQLLIQTAGILTFLTLRTIWESTGAFFGVDWLILSVIFLYIQLINTKLGERSEIPSV